MHLDVTPLCWVAPWPWPTFAADLPTDHNAEAWEEGFAKLVQYMEIEGDTRVSLRYQTDDGYNLGTWVSEQRQKKKKNKLSQDRQDRLEGLKGWVWEVIR